MLLLHKNTLRVRCLECKESQLLTLSPLGSENLTRTLGVETEYYFRGEGDCIHCTTKLRIGLTVWEYPIGQFNYLDQTEQGCLSMEELNAESFYITTDLKPSL